MGGIHCYWMWPSLLAPRGWGLEATWRVAAPAGPGATAGPLLCSSQQAEGMEAALLAYPPTRWASKCTLGLNELVHAGVSPQNPTLIYNDSRNGKERAIALLSLDFSSLPAPPATCCVILESYLTSLCLCFSKRGNNIILQSCHENYLLIQQKHCMFTWITAMKETNRVMIKK